MSSKGARARPAGPEAGLEDLRAPEPDAELLGLIDGLAAPVTEMLATTLGSIEAGGLNGRPLEEPDVLECRRAECLTGNITADALRLGPFGEAQLAIINGGALRNSLPGGPVTPGHVLGTLPFQNTPVGTEMSGAVLRQALEHGVATYGEGEGRFLQVSGLRYGFAPSQEAGRRVTLAEALDESGQWRPLDDEAVYRVVTLDFLSAGGDGFAMFRGLPWREGDQLANDALRAYIEKNSPVPAELQGRISLQ